MGTPRDYYADLELPASADVQEIKKQFRKLALKYHPDRNPGREQEVNVQFQIIQHAHEVLSDPEEKRKYDATRSRSRYPGASGVKGNPWSNAGDQFPPPPRRNQPPRTNATPSGAQRWQNRFSQGVPPTAKQYTAADQEAKKNAARAFENMRKGPPKAPPKPAEQPRARSPPPPPPRTESARQRAQASFGARRTGYHPRSATHGDEPPVTSNNYTSRQAPERVAQDGPNVGRPVPEPMPDPLSQFRDDFDLRQSTPYSKHGGEKTNPFDGVPLGRAKSTRDPPRHDPPTPEFATPTKQRSFSVPKEKHAEEPASGFEAPTEAPAPPPKIPMNTRPKAPLKKARSIPKPPFTTAVPDIPAAQPPQASPFETPSKPQTSTPGGPSMYETPLCSHVNHSPASFSNCSMCRTYNTHDVRPVHTDSHQDDAARHSHFNRGPSFDPSPSGGQDSPLQLTPFERQQQKFLAKLIQNAASGGSAEKRKHTDQKHGHSIPTNFANDNVSISFSFPVNDDTFARTSPDHHAFSRSSTDDINTSFVNDQDPDSWQFSAGGSEQGSPTKSRPQSANRTGRRSPNKRPTINRTDTASVPSSLPSESGKSEPAFDPDGWSNEFGPHTFVPQPSQSKSASPSRSMRGNPKKPKSVKTPGKATVVDDSSSDEEELPWRGRNVQGAPVAAESPQAMDIDSPPAAQETPTPTAAPASAPTLDPASVPLPFNPTELRNGARNINVEPSRPEWRPGNVNSEPKPPQSPSKEFNANAVGSEDSEEFLAGFSDLKNVAPFARQDTGLRSFTDLKDTLPFESKPSAKLPIKFAEAPQLVFPTAPVAPHLPTPVALNGMKPNMASWEKYVNEFENYLQQWDEFNGKVVDHFATRKANIANTRKSNGYSFLEARNDGDVQEYFNWLQQDGVVRKRWSAACEEHEQRFREFMAFRLKMK
ncbi:hypothetical protein AK830_g7802 [Neonectria ditissima]|uniref:J domain-containing protein n=1 Tax=Neonectria ditissima TaxID=78410 RepID=A0A0P7AYV7_9HYPO|nr:hypothetical protein AK830_g7802 [Neonectria ditissima]